MVDNKTGSPSGENKKDKYWSHSNYNHSPNVKTRIGSNSNETNLKDNKFSQLEMTNASSLKEKLLTGSEIDSSSLSPADKSQEERKNSSLQGEIKSTPQTEDNFVPQDTKEFVSKCCKSEMHNDSSEEGTFTMVCNKCGKNCDRELKKVIVTSPMPIFKNKEQDKEVKPIILDDNPLSLSMYAKEFPENWKQICEGLKPKKAEENKKEQGK